ncbi:hypothetical protein HON15_00040 [Candidatus Woesearchaeota archaeon]|jgi:hypothetical protein|nr:hypothetical protein [Candidatus Woesearchaeota archaeon]
MTYNLYINSETSSILCDFTISSDQSVTSTSSYSQTINIDAISGSSDVTVTNNIISLPKGYEFLVRFFVGISRNLTQGELYAKVEYSNGSSVLDATLAEIGGNGNNKTSLEDITCVIDTSSEAKDIVYKTYRNSDNVYTISLLSEYCYGIIIGFKK